MRSIAEARDAFASLVAGALSDEQQLRFLQAHGFNVEAAAESFFSGSMTGCKRPKFSAGTSCFKDDGTIVQRGTDKDRAVQRVAAAEGDADARVLRDIARLVDVHSIYSLYVQPLLKDAKRVDELRRREAL